MQRRRRSRRCAPVSGSISRCGSNTSDFLWNALTFDFGKSFVNSQSVAAMVGLNLPYTIELTIASTLIGTIAAIPLGVLAATHRGKAPDYVTRLFSLAGFAIPDFYLGALLLITFSLNLGWFPINGGGVGFVDRMYHVFLPAIALAFIKAAFVSRLTRSSLLEVLNKDFVRTARAKGGREPPRHLSPWPAQRPAAGGHRPRAQHPVDAVGVGRHRVHLRPTGRRQHAHHRHRDARLPGDPGRHRRLRDVRRAS